MLFIRLMQSSVVDVNRMLPIVHIFRIVMVVDLVLAKQTKFVCIYVLFVFVIFEFSNIVSLFQVGICRCNIGFIDDNVVGCRTMTMNRIDSNTDSNLAPIIGGVVGGGIVLIVIIIVIVCLSKRRNRQQQPNASIVGDNNNNNSNDNVDRPHSNYQPIPNRHDSPVVFEYSNGMELNEAVGGNNRSHYSNPRLAVVGDDDHRYSSPNVLAVDHASTHYSDPSVLSAN